MHRTIMLKPDYNMNWIDFITEFPLQKIQQSRTGAMANHALHKLLYGFCSHVM